MAKLALTLVPLLPLLGFVINAFWGKKLTPKASGTLASLSIGAAFVCALIVTGHYVWYANGVAVESYNVSWFTSQLFGKEFDVNLGLRFDHLSVVMALVITGVGTLIHIYSVGYMAHDKGYWRYFAYLNLFCFAMLCLALGDNLVLLFLGWEGVGLCSYLLIGFWYEDEEKAKAGKKAFVVNRIGDLGFLVGMMLLAWHFGTLDTAELTKSAGELAKNTAELTQNQWVFNAACISLFVGAVGKSAQIPLYVWLPDAMAGPTPVSALIHAATMVTAGVYMVCRLSAVYALSTWVLPAIAVVGAATAIFAASIGLVQRDIKKVLAYSTVSQLGYMFMAVGLGAYTFAVFHLMTHAFFKALLFLGSGSVIHSLEHGYGHGNPDSQDLRLMGGLKEKMPVTCWTMVIGGLALSGVPIFAGFFSKDEIILSAWLSELGVGKPVWILGIGAAAMTAFYTARLIALTFFGKFRGPHHVWEHAHESPRTMTVPLVILAIMSVVGGLVNIPHNLAHGADNFAQFLSGTFTTPSFAQSHGEHDHTSAEWGNMLFSVVIAIGMFYAGFKYYSRDGALSRADAKASAGLKPVFTTLLNKYYVDELYEKVIVRPIRIGAQLFFVFIDMLLIDLVFVNGSAFVMGALSHLMRRVQTGVVSFYLYTFSIGAVILLLVLLLW
ncbi:MAG: NADH-quinone oxidoreductase subunit L [Planctomycetaceae bacterium]|nr:NADH-quinone oxidoreductase subunit L [Planctomycetaceae bacterium]